MSTQKTLPKDHVANLDSGSSEAAADLDYIYGTALTHAQDFGGDRGAKFQDLADMAKKGYVALTGQNPS